MALTFLPYDSLAPPSLFSFTLSGSSLSAGRETSIVFYIECQRFVYAFVKRCWQLVDWALVSDYLSLSCTEISNAKLESDIFLLFTYISVVLYFILFNFILCVRFFFVAPFGKLAPWLFVPSYTNFRKRDDLMPIYQSIKLCFEFLLIRNKIKIFHSRKKGTKKKIRNKM